MVFKSDGSTELTTAVDALQRHRSIFSSRVCDLILHGYLGQHPGLPVAAITPRLTLREREVVQLVGESKTSKQIAAMLGVSLKTAELHRSNIMILNLHSTVELVLYAVRNEITHVQLPAMVFQGRPNGNNRAQVAA
jgi:DNA-binding NarL/FixJ family response regulator